MYFYDDKNGKKLDHHESKMYVKQCLSASTCNGYMNACTFEKKTVLIITCTCI